MINNNNEKQKAHIKTLIKKSQREANEIFENRLENAQEAFYFLTNLSLLKVKLKL